MSKSLKNIFILSLLTIACILCLCSCEQFHDYTEEDARELLARYKIQAELRDTDESDDGKTSTWTYYNAQEDLEFHVFEWHIPITFDASEIGMSNYLKTDYYSQLTKKYLDEYDGEVIGTFTEYVYDADGKYQAYILYNYSSRSDLERVLTNSEALTQYLKKIGKGTSVSFEYCAADDAKKSYTRDIEIEKWDRTSADQVRSEVLRCTVYHQNQALLQEWTEDEIETFLESEDDRIYVREDGKWNPTQYIGREDWRDKSDSDYEIAGEYSNETFEALLSEAGYVVVKGNDDIQIKQGNTIVKTYSKDQYNEVKTIPELSDDFDIEIRLKSHGVTGGSKISMALEKIRKNTEKVWDGIRSFRRNLRKWLPF